MPLLSAHTGTWQIRCQTFLPPTSAHHPVAAAALPSSVDDGDNALRVGRLGHPGTLNRMDDEGRMHTPQPDNKPGDSARARLHPRPTRLIDLTQGLQGAEV
ncbi:hypothetical protein BRM50_01085, partial [Xanthomonas oryzae pv. oryzae]